MIGRKTKKAGKEGTQAQKNKQVSFSLSTKPLLILYADTECLLILFADIVNLTIVLLCDHRS